MNYFVLHGAHVAGHITLLLVFTKNMCFGKSFHGYCNKIKIFRRFIISNDLLDLYLVLSKQSKLEVVKLYLPLLFFAFDSWLPPKNKWSYNLDSVLFLSLSNSLFTKNWLTKGAVQRLNWFETMEFKTVYIARVTHRGMVGLIASWVHEITKTKCLIMRLGNPMYTLLSYMKASMYFIKRFKNIFKFKQKNFQWIILFYCQHA
jgi:hypothetical protein